MTPPHPTLRQAARVWARIALLSFGGPAGQIAVMHRILVEERRWLGEGRFLHALNFCMLLPGPEAQQLATYVGWLMHGVRGALLAGMLFILPGLVSIMALSWIYVGFGDVPLVGAAFFGLKAAVLAIVVQAVLRLGRRALRGPVMLAVAAASFVAIFVFAVPFPLIVAGAALVGWAGPRGAARDGAGDEGTLLAANGGPAPRGTLLAGLAALALWLLPMALLAQGVFADIAALFSRMAMLSFGGAYAVLAWVAQDAVETRGWLSAGEMLDGLGMAETTPGPLIMVLQFVGFLAAYREAGWPSPLLAGTLGGLLASWVTFAPCFAWILIGAPFMERLRQNRALAAALAAVTAAVVGVILNLAIWFGIHVIWTETQAGPLALTLPVWPAVNWVAAGLSALAFLALFRLRLGVPAVLSGAAGLGIAAHLAGLA
ncbi:chromate efflux transporter [Falsirhodobacter xinxiangensis]|uniref:chromate efflux transporter n=1 Tax=Falsirhodobacter xinxiangensis TaxID=2530049 RepID=UPI0010AB140E|nr:chromate efflux transporter [Rhodobacter xinxiangensis]